MSAVRLHCRACGQPVSGPLTELVTSSPPGGRDGEDVVPVGTFWRWEPSFDLGPGAAGDLVCARSDLELVACGNRSGCCGPSGLDGPNLACRCGAVVGTEVGDCWQANYVALGEVFACPSAEPGRPLHVWPGGANATVWELASWLHASFSLEDWLGDDLTAIARVCPPAVIVFSRAQAARDSGAPVDRWAGKPRAGGLDVRMG